MACYVISIAGRPQKLEGRAAMIYSVFSSYCIADATLIKRLLCRSLHTNYGELVMVSKKIKIIPLLAYGAQRILGA
jgi:hypothetical protein